MISLLPLLAAAVVATNEPDYDLQFAVDYPKTNIWLNANGVHFCQFQGTNAWVTNEPAYVTAWTATAISNGIESLPSNLVWTTNGFANTEILVYGTGMIWQSSKVDGPYIVTHSNANGLFFGITNPPGSQFFRETNKLRTLRLTKRCFN